MEENDISEELKLQLITSIQLMIPKQIKSYIISDLIDETNLSVLLSAYSKEFKNSSQKLAIKCVSVKNFNPNLPDWLSNLNHPSILPIYDVFYYPDVNARFYGLVMPYIETDLCNFFYKTKNSYLDEIVVCQIMKKALEIVSYVHSNGLCHCDLKIENFLLSTKNKRLKLYLIDFDSAIPLSDGNFTTGSVGGTVLNSPPELIDFDLDDKLEFKKNAIFDNKIDSWCMGIVMATLLIGSNPFHSESNSKFLFLVKNGFNSDDCRFCHLTTYATNLLSKLLCVDPTQRISVEDALNHDWFILFLQSYLLKHPEANIIIDDDEEEEKEEGIDDETDPVIYSA